MVGTIWFNKRWTRYIIETKINRHNLTRTREDGIAQVSGKYLASESVEEGYLVIFDIKTQPGEVCEPQYHEVGNKKVTSFTIGIGRPDWNHSGPLKIYPEEREEIVTAPDIKRQSKKVKYRPQFSVCFYYGFGLIEGPWVSLQTWSLPPPGKLWQTHTIIPPFTRFKLFTVNLVNLSFLFTIRLLFFEFYKYLFIVHR